MRFYSFSIIMRGIPLLRSLQRIGQFGRGFRYIRITPSACSAWATLMYFYGCLIWCCICAEYENTDNRRENNKGYENNFVVQSHLLPPIISLKQVSCLDRLQKLAGKRDIIAISVEVAGLYYSMT